MTDKTGWRRGRKKNVRAYTQVDKCFCADAVCVYIYIYIATYSRATENFMDMFHVGPEAFANGWTPTKFVVMSVK